MAHSLGCIGQMVVPQASGRSRRAHLFRVPRPVNSSVGNCSGMDCVTAFTCLSTCRAEIAGKPSRFCLTFLTTKMGCVHSVPLYTNLTVASPVTSNGWVSGP